MRPEEIPLDLNNLPDDYCRDGKQVVLQDDSSSSGCRKKKNGVGKEGKEEWGKVYECRFCSLKFCKSQALGGHMNRHRQERETETLNHARQLVFRSDPTIAPPHHLGCCQGIGGEGAMGVRYPRYLSAASSSTHISPPPPPPPPPPAYNLYASPTRGGGGGGVSSYPPSQSHEYYVGHVMHNYGGVGESSSYTCVGAPVGQAGSIQMQRHQEEVVNWGRTYPSPINRFHDGFL